MIDSAVGLHVITRASLPQWAVEEAGAPVEVYTEIISPPNSPNLYYDVTWVNKTATRLPEVSGVPQKPPGLCGVIKTLSLQELPIGVRCLAHPIG